MKKISRLAALRALASERGSLALEQVLFIGAIALVGAGVIAFYSNLDNYFRSVDVADGPGMTAIGSPTGTAQN